MSETSKSGGEGLLYLLAVVVIAVLVAMYFTMGLAGVGLVMVVATPIMIVLLMIASGGR